MPMDSPSDIELPADEQAFLDDRSLDLGERIERAKAIGRGREIAVPVAELTTVEGESVPDKHVPSDKLGEIFARFGFPKGQHEGTQYDARTRSTTDSQLTLQIKEGPFEIGEPSEAFPEGRTWSVYDHTLSIRILVQT